MTTLPKACAEAARVYVAEHSDAESRARRVILALAKELPESALRKAMDVFWATKLKINSDIEAVEAAIKAFLEDVGGASDV